MSDTTTITDPPRAGAGTGAGAADFESEAFETPQSALGLDSGDDLADEIESLLNEASNQPESSDSTESTDQDPSNEPSEGFQAEPAQNDQAGVISDDQPTDSDRSSEASKDNNSSAEATPSIPEASTEASSEDESDSVTEPEEIEANAAETNQPDDSGEAEIAAGPHGVLGYMESALRQTCLMVNAPLAGLSPEMRSIVGYAALATLLNAAAFLLYALLT